MFIFKYFDGSVLTGYTYEEYDKDYFVDDYRIVSKCDIESIEEVENDD